MTKFDFITCDTCGKNSAHPIVGSVYAYCFECEVTSEIEAESLDNPVISMLVNAKGA